MLLAFVSMPISVIRRYRFVSCPKRRSAPTLFLAMALSASASMRCQREMALRAGIPSFRISSPLQMVIRLLFCW